MPREPKVAAVPQIVPALPNEATEPAVPPPLCEPLPPSGLDAAPIEPAVPAVPQIEPLVPKVPPLCELAGLDA